MDFLKEGIGLRGYAQVDPLIAYTNESYELWNQLMREIQEEIALEYLPRPLDGRGGRISKSRLQRPSRR